MSDESDTARIGVARAYVDALVSHDPSGVRFAPECVRVEMGVKTGFSGAHLSRSLRRGPQYRSILGMREFHASVDGDVVRVRYELDAGLFGKRLVAVRVDEDFWIPADRMAITRIEARIYRAG